MRHEFDSRIPHSKTKFLWGIRESNREESRRNGSFSVAENSEALETEGFLRRSETTSEIANASLFRTGIYRFLCVIREFDLS